MVGHGGMVSYRTSKGIPGYTGYCPSSDAIAQPIKGLTKHTGKQYSQADFDRQLAGVGAVMQTSSSAGLTMNPELFATHARAGGSKGGQWIKDRMNEYIPPAKFIGQSLHRDDFKLARGGYDKEDKRVKGIAAEDVRDPERNPVGYATSYQSMVVKGPKVGGVAAPGKIAELARSGIRTQKPLEDPAPDFGRVPVLPHVLNPPFHGRSITQSTMVDHDRSGIRNPDNRELQAGTTLATKHIPGYSGFISKHASEAKGSEETASSKNILLAAIDQYSRDRLPGYAGYRAKEPRNIKPDNPPSKATEKEHRLQSTLKFYDASSVDKSQFINANKGHGSFFTGGQKTVSDNGKANAHMYYRINRPLEGAIRPYYPNFQADRGQNFQN